jgi:tetratricopeptide (TPR) repeat protein
MKERNKRGSNTSLDYFSSALRALSRIRGSADADLRAECLFECIGYFFQLGQESKALESATLLLALAALVGDVQLLRRGHNCLGAIYADQGNLADALVHYSRALDLSRQIDDAWGLAGRGDQYWRSAELRRLVQRGDPCFERGASLSQRLAETRDHLIGTGND